MQNKKLSFIILFLLLGLLLHSAWSKNQKNYLSDDFSHIIVKASQTEGVPKSSSIVATINGHVLSVVFDQNFGQVVIEVSTTSGIAIDTNAIYTPNGVNFFIPNLGNYVVTFTFPDGDIYYGEFEVTN